MRQLHLEATVAPTEQIAFYAYLSTNTKAYLPQHHTLIYDVVRINKVQGYHQDDGIITVPSPGAYVCLDRCYSSQWICNVQVVVHEEVFGSTFADDDGGNGSSDYRTWVAVLETHTGDHIYIRMHQ